MLTPAGESLSSQLRVPAEMVVEFIAVYGRLEFALKRAGYAQLRREPDEFSLRWERLWTEVGPAFSPDVSDEVRKAVNYLRSRPPKKEVWADGCVDWKEIPAEAGEFTLAGVMQHVQRARNNLFHGGKFATAPEDPVRNENVLRSSVVILDEIVRLCESHAPQVYSAFRSPNY